MKEGIKGKRMHLQQLQLYTWFSQRTYNLAGNASPVSRVGQMKDAHTAIVVEATSTFKLAVGLEEMGHLLEAIPEEWWIAELADFHFTIKYRPGRENNDADALSRMPLDVESMMKEYSEDLCSDVVMAAIQSVEAQREVDVNWSVALVTQAPSEESSVESVVPIPKDELRKAQKSDPSIKPVLEYKLQGCKPSAQTLKEFSSKTRCLFREWDKLTVDGDGIMYRITATRKQLVLPEQYKARVLEELHNNMGHQGAERTVSLVRDRFFWPHLQSDVEHYVTRACVCLKQKKPSRENRAPLTNIVTTQPFELVSVDFLHLDQCKGGYQYILAIVDHFTRFGQAYATTSKSGKVAANLLFNDYALKFGFPARIYHDQGGEFENQLFAQLKKLTGVSGSRTTPYHPMGNGQVERMNRTLLQMLKTLTERQKSNWKEHLNKLLYAYNCTRSEVSGYSPFYLLFGRSPRLPVDMLFGLSPQSDPKGPQDFVQAWKQGMEEAYTIARKNIQKASEKGKRCYDSKVRSSVLQPRDRVLVKNLSPRGGPGKLRNYWEDGIHTVVKRMGSDLPIYEVRPEQGKGRSRILHRNLLMPCDHLPLETPDPSCTPRGKQERRPRPAPQPLEVDTDSEDEGTFSYVVPQAYVRQEDRHLQPEPGPNAQAVEQSDEMFEGETLTVPDETDENAGDRPMEHQESPEHSPVQRNEIPSTSMTAESDDQVHQRPQRDRHPPKRTTYDQLGIPSCYQVEQTYSGQLPIQAVPLFPFPGLIAFQPPFSLAYGQV
ncbi:hypothetical protein NFI96_001880 [Prochilodus magdalenae]|nr:hypothetical protein NFI96_001880 [Prochilodus magdalenae]